MRISILCYFTAFIGATFARPHSPFAHRSVARRLHEITSEPVLEKRQSSNSTTSSNSTSTTSSSGKLVVAHHMVGNTYPYAQADWLADIQLASENGLDGFALNVGSDSWQPDRVADAYAAAESFGTDFKLFISFDMSSLACTDASDASTLTSYLTTYASHPNQLTVNGAVFASSFDGADCTFGQSSASAGWQNAVFDAAGLSGGVHFVPAFFIDTSDFTEFDGVIDGMFNWNGGWPVDTTVSSAESLISSFSSDILESIFPSSIESALNASVGIWGTDATWVSGLDSVSGGSNTYMAAVSPWFYTHYSPETYDKNWIYLSDYHLYNDRWEALVENRDSIDVVEVVTWNDYGESSYIGPIEGAQPDSQDWVDGMNHTGWLQMTKYYADAFRTGSYPSVDEDQVYLWARPHPKAATASDDPVGPPTTYQLTEDKLWAVVFATEAGTVTLTTADGTSETYDVGAGVTKLSMALTTGSGMSATLTRNDQTVVSVEPGDAYTFNGSPTTYNYNAFVAYSSSG